jgi:hypothetical protein
MRREAIGCAVLLCCGSACSPTIRTTDQPPAEAAAAEPDLSTAQKMTIWLQAFGAEQRQEFSMSERYCSEVTCDGRVTPLPKPYETRYWVSGSGKSYRVEVRHVGSRRICRLEDGFDAYPERAGVVLCTSY